MPLPHRNPNPNPTCTSPSDGTCQHSLFLILLLFPNIFHPLPLSLPSSFSPSPSPLPYPYSSPSPVPMAAVVVPPVRLSSAPSLEYDLQLQSEDQLRSGKGPVEAVERLPWKGGTEKNPDYECLGAELRKMAPVNGRAVLLFRDKCGCPVAKLVGWEPRKRTGWNKSEKVLAGVAHNRKGDYG